MEQKWETYNQNDGDDVHHHPICDMDRVSINISDLAIFTSGLEPHGDTCVANALFHVMKALGIIFSL